MKRTLLVAVTIMLLRTSDALAAGNLISNPVFENPQAVGTPETFYPGSSIGGWLVSGTGTNHVYLWWDPIPSLGGNGIEGFQNVQIKNSARNGANLSQILNFEPGSTYELSFYVGSADPDNAPSQLDIVSYYPANTLQNNYAVGSIPVPSTGGIGIRHWRQHVLYFTPQAGQERLFFRNDSDGYLLLDDVNLVAVPEPSTLALAGLVIVGLTGCGFNRPRRCCPGFS